MMTHTNTPGRWEQQGLEQLGEALRERRVSAPELARHFLQRIEQHADLGAWLAVDETRTLAQAEAADQRLDTGALAGLPLALDDRLVTQAFATTAASRMLEGYRSPFDATVVERLQEQGAVFLGKLNGDEFGMGASGTQSAYRPVRNPWHAERVPGGACGGAAAAVAAGLAPAAIGVDSAGDLRIPASLCGLTALRPTWGRVSRHGLVAQASSMDAIGPLARSARDCALLLSQICGPDPDRDSTSLDEPAADFMPGLDGPVQGLRIGIAPELWGAPLQDGARAVLDAALAGLLEMGLQRVDIALPLSVHAQAVCDTLGMAEASTNLSRYDGVRFGHRTASPADLQQLYELSRAEGLGPEVQARILYGTHVLSQAQYASHYQQAQKLRRLMADEWQQAFRTCDLVLAPVTAGTAWSVDEQPEQPQAFTAPASLVGLPALSLPAGQDADGLPLGLQLIAPHLHEQRLLAVGHAWQQGTDWHTRRPRGF